MSLLTSFRNLLSNCLHRTRVDRDMEEELFSHLQHRADDLERSGISRPEAVRLARIEFGGVERIKEQCRDSLGSQFGQALLQDVRYGFRMMRKSPVFTAVAVLTLAIGICANAVVFSVLNALVLRPIDLPRPESLFMVEYGKHHFMQSYPDYVDMRERSRAFEGVLAFGVAAAGLDSGQGSSRTWLYEASGNYFDVLGIQPYLGRFFHASDEHGPDSAPFIVLGYAHWQNHYQGDPGVIGRTVLLNKYPFTIIGVAPPRFRGTALIFSADMWIPLVHQAQMEGESTLNLRGRRNIFVIGRLRPQATRAQLTGELDAFAASLARAYPKSDDDASFALTRPELMGDFVGQGARAFVGGMMLLAGLILLAACANLGSLFAARAADRSKELALRLALGSTRGRIMRQLLTESVLIALAGGLLGLAASMALLPRLSAWQPLPEFPINVPVNPDATVYAVALLLAVISGMFFGMVPARQVLTTNPYQVIKAGHAGVTPRLTLRELLLAGQIAVCAVLVTSSLVAARGLVRSLHSDFGILTQNTILVNTDLGMARYNRDQQPLMHRRMLDAALSLPGVTAAGYSNTIPLNMDQLHSRVYLDTDTDLRPTKAAAPTLEYAVSPGYFEAAGTPLLAGRSFTWHDDQGVGRVAVVNREFARRVFGSVERAVGAHYKHRDGTRIEVIGITGDGKYANLTEDPQAVVFLSILQQPSSRTWLIVRTTADARPAVAAALNHAMRALDGGLPFTMQTWDQELSTVLFPARVATVSLGVLGALGAMLALTGIFGMAAYSVSKRLREFGIRIALGARRKEVVQSALGRTFRLLACGSVAGVLLGMAAGRVLAYIVYQATPRDPMVLGGVLLTMLTVGLLAAWIPALRAIASDPLTLLREE